MSKREAVKSAIMQRVEARLEQVLGDEQTVMGMTLTEIEEVAMRVGDEAQVAVTSQLVEAASGRCNAAAQPMCPECGGEMRHKGYRDKGLITRSGEVKVRRAYYTCGRCGVGVFPPG